MEEMDDGGEEETKISTWLNNRRMSVNPRVYLHAVDFSFLRLASFGEVEGEDPRMDSACPRVDPKTGKFVASTVRFNNNSISELVGLERTVQALLFDPTILSWLDLSFNLIPGIDNNLTVLTSLQVLYLHGNCISSMADVAKLAALRRLRALTLHGNPVEEQTTLYRTRVLLLLPWLLKMDFSLVTRRDRAIMQYNMLPPPRAKAKKKDEDDAAV